MLYNTFKVVVFSFSILQYVCYQLYACFGLACDHGNILDLESSTPHKFSRHLVFHLPSSSFRNNIHIGKLIPFLVCGSHRSVPITF